MKPDKHSEMRDIQPINWLRAMGVGMLGALCLMGFIDIFYMAGLTPFNLEHYMGSIIRGTEVGAHNWTVGFLANLFLGAIFGFVYAYVFEYFFYRADPRTGTLFGVAHAVIAAVAFFPFFNIVKDSLGLEMYPSFGILGSGIGIGTMAILFVGHVFFGTAMGTFYGPVRMERVRAQNFEPGETGLPGEPGVITEEDDPEDRVSA